MSDIQVLALAWGLSTSGLIVWVGMLHNKLDRIERKLDRHE